MFLSLIFFAAFFIRVVGVNPGYPPNHPDEPITYSTAISMVLNIQPDPFTFSSYKFQYPGLLIYLDALVFGVFFIPFSLLHLLITNPPFFVNNIGRFNELVLNVVGPGWIESLFWGRYVVSILSFLSIPLVYLIGRDLFNRYVGLLSALFLAVDLRHAISSHLSLVDGPNGTFAILALYLCLRLLKRPTRKNYILAGVGVGLSFAVKLYIFSLLPLMLAHLVICFKGNNVASGLKRLLQKEVILTALTIFIIFILLNPFLLFHVATALTTQSINNLRYAFGNDQLMLPPLWYLYEIGYGKFFSLLFIFGVVMILFNRRYWLKGLFLGFFILIPCWVLLYYTHGGGYVRNFTSVIPFATVISAVGLYSLSQFLFGKSKFFFPLLMIFALLISLPQLSLSLKSTYYLSQPWNSLCIQDQMGKMIGNTMTVARTTSVPYVPNKNVQYVVYNNYYAKKTPYDLAELENTSVSYLVINYDFIQSTFINWTGDGTRYWSPPINQFDNTFDGLAVKQLTRYRVADCVKPWPYIGENFSLIKIPQVNSNRKMKLIFSSSKERQTHFKNYDVPDKMVIIDSLPVQPGKTYLISAQVKSSKSIEEIVRDGFLRADFFEPDKTNKSRGTVVGLSQRYFGADWQSETVSETAPKTARVLKLSIQAEDYTNNFFVKNIQVFESKDKSTPEEIQRANAPEIDNLIIYPTAIL